MKNLVESSGKTLREQKLDFSVGSSFWWIEVT